MSVEALGEHEFGSHAIGARYEQWFLHAFQCGSREQATEATDISDHFVAIGRFHSIANRIYGTRTFLRVDDRLLYRLFQTCFLLDEHEIRLFTRFRALTLQEAVLAKCLGDSHGVSAIETCGTESRIGGLDTFDQTFE